MEATARIYHLSHNDLDGYGAQFVVSQAFYNVAYFNADYKDIDKTFQEMMKRIKMDILTGTQVDLVLITDVNLTEAQAQFIETQLNKLDNPPKLLLLDHHATGEVSAKKHEWYQLDTSVCATRLTYNWVRQFFAPEQTELDARMDRFSDMVNVTDMWLQGHENFEKANYLSSMVFERDNLCPEMDEVSRQHKFFLVDKVFDIFDQGGTIRQAETSLYEIKEAFLLDQGLSEDIVRDDNQAIANKYFSLVFDFVMKHGFSVIEIDGHKSAVFYNWQHSVFQHVTARLFEESDKVDMAIRIAPQGRVSFRSETPDVNVGNIAAQYFGGGGHPCASGGALKVKKVNNEAEGIKIINQMIGA